MSIQYFRIEVQIGKKKKKILQLRSSHNLSSVTRLFNYSLAVPTYLYVYLYNVCFHLRQFESWWSSLTCVATGSSPRFVVDGQAPLRQCLHPEACNKDLELPSHYTVFHDLRKEFATCYSSQDDLATLSIQDMLQCILSSIISFVVQTSNLGKILFCNSACCKITNTQKLLIIHWIDYSIGAHECSQGYVGMMLRGAPRMLRIPVNRGTPVRCCSPFRIPRSRVILILLINSDSFRPCELAHAMA